MLIAIGWWLETSSPVTAFIDIIQHEFLIIIYLEDLDFQSLIKKVKVNLYKD